ncbi:MAG TPA: hypothetical protein VI386_09810, partial [Candidatus Sulfotelmatobacter sp.]
AGGAHSSPNRAQGAATPCLLFGYAGRDPQLSCSGKRTHSVDFTSSWGTMTLAGYRRTVVHGKASNG